MRSCWIWIAMAALVAWGGAETFAKKGAETGFVEFGIHEDDACCFVKVKDLPLPQQVNLVSIKREGKVIIPRGRHQLAPGDVLTVFGILEEIQDLKEFLNSNKMEKQD